MNLLFFGGPPKTGTSAFQYYANKLLKNKKFYYPESCQWTDSSHHPLVFSFFNISQWGKLTSYETVISKLKEEIDLLNFTPNTLVLSSEAIAYKPGLENFFFSLIKNLNLNEENIKIVYFCRNYEQLMLSRYNQLIKDFNEKFHGTFEEYYEKFFDKLSYKSLKFNDIFKFQFENYHSSQEFIFRIFKKYFDLKVNEAERRNVSMLNDTMILIAILRRFTNKSQDEVFNYLKSNNLMKFGHNDSFLSSNQQKKLEDLYKNEVEELNLIATEMFKKSRRYNIDDFQIPFNFLKDFNIDLNEINDFIVSFGGNKE